MGSKNDMTRKEFLMLTFTLVGTTAAVSACSDDNNNNVDASFGGNNGSAGTTGGGGTTGSGGRGGSGGAAGTGGGGGNTAASCSDPLPETQSVSDHTHTLTIAASTLNATSAQTFDTGVAAGHMHAVTLEPAQLTTLKGGSSVMVTSTSSVGHTHVFTISCH